MSRLNIGFISLFHVCVLLTGADVVVEKGKCPVYKCQTPQRIPPNCRLLPREYPFNGKICPACPTISCPTENSPRNVGSSRWKQMLMYLYRKNLNNPRMLQFIRASLYKLYQKESGVQASTQFSHKITGFRKDDDTNDDSNEDRRQIRDRRPLKDDQSNVPYVSTTSGKNYQNPESDENLRSDDISEENKNNRDKEISSKRESEEIHEDDYEDHNVIGDESLSDDSNEHNESTEDSHQDERSDEIVKSDETLFSEEESNDNISDKSESEETDEGHDEDQYESKDDSRSKEDDSNESNISKSSEDGDQEKGSDEDYTSNESLHSEEDKSDDSKDSSESRDNEHSGEKSNENESSEEDNENKVSSENNEYESDEENFSESNESEERDDLVDDDINDIDGHEQEENYEDDDFHDDSSEKTKESISVNRDDDDDVDNDRNDVHFGRSSSNIRPESNGLMNRRSRHEDESSEDRNAVKRNRGKRFFLRNGRGNTHDFRTPFIRGSNENPSHRRLNQRSGFAHSRMHWFGRRPRQWDENSSREVQTYYHRYW